MRPCPTCNTRNKASAAYCLRCGARLEAAPTPPTPPPVRPAPPRATLPQPPPSALGAPARIASKRLRGFLVSFDFHANGQHWVLQLGRNGVGRDPNQNTVVLERDPTVSRTHCLIVCRADSVYVRDQDSEHGTRVNGRDIGPDAVTLKDGDVLTVCGYEMRVKLL